MPQYKLIYFNGRGAVEQIRYLFALADEPYEDVRIKFEDWPKMKNDTPFGALPILEVDGAKICQTSTIVRFLSKRFGFAGKTEMDQVRADMIERCVQDAVDDMFRYRREQDPTRKAEIKDKLETEGIPGEFEKLEKLLVTNNGGDSYFVGDSLTYADLSFATYCDMVHAMFKPKVDLDKIPKSVALRKKVDSNPKIAAWIAKRPHSDI